MRVIRKRAGGDEVKRFYVVYKAASHNKQKIRKLVDKQKGC